MVSFSNKGRSSTKAKEVCRLPFAFLRMAWVVSIRPCESLAEKTGQVFKQSPAGSGPAARAADLGPRRRRLADLEGARLLLHPQLVSAAGYLHHLGNATGGTKRSRGALTAAAHPTRSHLCKIDIFFEQHFLSPFAERICAVLSSGAKLSCNFAICLTAS